MTWSGRKVADARTYWAPRLPLPCYLCGKPVLPTHPWVVEHTQPRSLGGHDTARSNQWVSHRGCSNRSGGQMGAALTNGRKTNTEAVMASKRSRGIRGV